MSTKTPPPVPVAWTCVHTVHPARSAGAGTCFFSAWAEIFERSALESPCVADFWAAKCPHFRVRGQIFVAKVPANFACVLFVLWCTCLRFGVRLWKIVQDHVRTHSAQFFCFEIEFCILICRFCVAICTLKRSW